jgi:hypothetical protein
MLQIAKLNVGWNELDLLLVIHDEVYKLNFTSGMPKHTSVTAIVDMRRRCLPIAHIQFWTAVLVTYNETALPTLSDQPDSKARICVHGSFAYTLAYVFHAGNSADNTDTEMTRN